MAQCRSEFPVAMMSRVLGVSRAGFYEWLQREPVWLRRAGGEAGLPFIRLLYHRLGIVKAGRLGENQGEGARSRSLGTLQRGGAASGIAPTEIGREVCPHRFNSLRQRR